VSGVERDFPFVLLRSTFRCSIGVCTCVRACVIGSLCASEVAIVVVCGRSGSKMISTATFYNEKLQS